MGKLRKGISMTQGQLMSMFMMTGKPDVYPEDWLHFCDYEELKWHFSDLVENGCLIKHEKHYGIAHEMHNMRRARLKDEQFVRLRVADAEIVPLYRTLEFYEVRSKRLGITLGVMHRTRGQAWGSAKRYIVQRERE